MTDNIKSEEVLYTSFFPKNISIYAYPRSFPLTGFVLNNTESKDKSRYKIEGIEIVNEDSFKLSFRLKGKNVYFTLVQGIKCTKSNKQRMVEIAKDLSEYIEEYIVKSDDYYILLTNGEINLDMVSKIPIRCSLLSKDNILKKHSESVFKVDDLFKEEIMLNIYKNIAENLTTDY